MLILRKIQNEEFSAFCDCVITDYGQDIAQKHDLSIEKAAVLAQEEFHNYFPDGVATLGHDVLCIELDIEEPTTIGYLWCSNKKSDLSAFIYFFYIEEQFRGKGYGKQALKQLDDWLLSSGATKVRLQVLAQNQRALELYQKSGFDTYSYVLSKKLTD